MKIVDVDLKCKEMRIIHASKYFNPWACAGGGQCRGSQEPDPVLRSL